MTDSIDSNLNYCPRLIEVALPIREISAESVRDKSLRHGHISTLHLWWARRPLAASRAVVFASLVPDPDDPGCPKEFQKAVDKYLKREVPVNLRHYLRGRNAIPDEDPYRPYDGLPDTLRNRLLTFIAKWSPEMLAFESGKAKQEPKPAQLLDDRSLVKWETSDPENPQGREILRIARELVRIANDGELPTVLDPFAGGGAIPLEAGRLGCQAIANDYNPVAYLILRATCEFPQKYGKPGWRVGGQASGWSAGFQPANSKNLDPATTQFLFDNPDTKKTRRDLPHWELEGRIYFVTFSTRERLQLPEQQRQIVLDAFHHWNGSRIRLHIVCVMPDHVHALIEPINGHELSKVLHSIKSFTANKINESLAREGSLWQIESFDRIIRDPEDYEQKLEYIRTNPVKDGLIREVEDYRWLFCDQVVKKCSLEGCPPTFVPNVLVHDVERWAKWTLERARDKIGHLYPPGKDGRPVVGYLWARTAPCSNPSCRGEIPLLRSLLVCNKKDKKVALTLDLDREAKKAFFEIAKGNAIKRVEGSKRERGPAICLYCEQPTSEPELRAAGQAGEMGERMVAVIVEAKGGKEYRPVEETDIKAFQQALEMEVEAPGELILPEINAENSPDDISNSTGIRVHLYGMKTWGSLFNHRQLVAMQTFVGCLHEALEEMQAEIRDEAYRKVVGTYLGLWLSRNAMRMSSVGRWDVGGETFQTPFDGAKLPMKWDYPEANPFCGVTGGFLNQLNWITAFLAQESPAGTTPGKVLRGDGAALVIPDFSADATVTDPPYFDEAAYADLSDFFYIWLKRAIGDVVPEVLVTPLTPKTDEATALKHRHGGDAAAADKHFTEKLTQVFEESKRVTKPGGLYSIVFAHQETEAWTALIRSLFAAGLTIDATWPIEMEMKNRMRGLNSAALETSITVICRPRVVGSAASFKAVRNEIEHIVTQSVKRFWSYGFRGADLIVGCYGPAVGIFGKYGRVEKADGTPVSIPELLELARRAARDAIAGEFRGDNLSSLYYVWACLYGAAEQAWDDARLVVQIGGGAGFEPADHSAGKMPALQNRGIFVVDGSSCRLALLKDRADQRGLGMDQNPPLIDGLHRAMLFWKEEKRASLVSYLSERGLLEDGPFWKLAQALFEVLPRELEDWKLVSALLTERETLRSEGRRAGMAPGQKGFL